MRVKFEVSGALLSAERKAGMASRLAFLYCLINYRIG